MIDRLKPYPSYNDSGVEWLGEVPENWEILPLCAIAKPRQVTNEQHRELLSVYLGRGVVPFSSIDEKRTNPTSEDLSRYQAVEPGDFVLNNQQAWRGSVGVSRYQGIVSPAYLVLALDGRLERDFADSLLAGREMVAQYLVSSKGVGTIQRNLYWPHLRRVALQVPPSTEQTAIVRFLGYMDRRIQRLIRAKQRLIKLLEEQKQAIIHEAVTGRIDVRTGKPYPSYKDSGVEWLGEVPEQWVVRRLRNAAEMLVSNVDKHTKEGEKPVRLCNYVDVYKNDRIRPGMSFMRATATSDEVARFRLHTGDVLITKDSEAWNDIGVPALVEETAEDLISGYHIALLRPFKDHVDSEYLLRALQSKCVAYQFHVEANGVTRYGLAHRAIKSICLPLPSLPEQTAIVQHVDSQLASLSRSIESSRRAIDLLKEYRTRLISDVVTGKVDVREAAALLPDEPDDEPIEEHDAEDEAPDLDEPVGSEEEGEE